jgi:alkanesulfonate monooxygenase SsuD/methylene tetrahydromethanopterin reductase-like flavin-dependent oxidoreductase (luciferase family)
MDSDPVIVSPGGSGPGLAFAGRNSDVQLALAPLRADAITAYRERIHAAAVEHGRTPDDIRVLFVVKPELVASREEADRIVAASHHPSDAAIAAVLEGQSSDLETDLTVLDLDRPLPEGLFGQHVSRGTIAGLLGDADPATTPLRELAVRKARKGRLRDGSGLVGTADEFADFVETLGDAGNDGLILSGDLHPTTLHRMLDELVPVLRRRGLLRREFGGGGLRANLFDF